MSEQEHDTESIPISSHSKWQDMMTAKVVGDVAVVVSIKTSCKAEVRKVRIEGVGGKV